MTYVIDEFCSEVFSDDLQMIFQDKILLKFQSYQRDYYLGEIFKKRIIFDEAEVENEHDRLKYSKMIHDDVAMMSQDSWQDSHDQYFKSIIAIAQIVKSDRDFLLDELLKLKQAYRHVTDKHFQIILQIRADIPSKEIAEMIQQLNSAATDSKTEIEQDDPFKKIIFDNQLASSVKNEFKDLARRVTKLQAKSGLKKEITSVREAATEAMRRRRESIDAFIEDNKR